MRVLIVSPHFPPTNCADLHRVRLLLPYLAENGWDAEVLAVEPNQVVCPLDAWLEAGLPPDVPVHRVHALGRGWAKIPGLGTLGFRALRALRKQGDALFRERQFDLVYFSTTVFETLVLGPRWKREFGVPFVVDYQDPWVSDYYREHPEVVPPGGRLKNRAIDFIHRRMEPKVFADCGGVTAVSAAYPAQLARRYPGRQNVPTLVIPFPGEPSELERVTEEDIQQNVFEGNDGKIHWVYAGVFIPAMHDSLRALFRSLRDHADPLFKKKLVIHFVGTCDSSRAVVLLAAEYGIEDAIREHPTRLPYAQALACLRDADALLVIGSNDPDYTASKVYPYLLARKPLLIVFHEKSSVVSLMKTVGGGVCIPIGNETTEATLASSIAQFWLNNEQYAKVVPLDEKAFVPFTASSQAEQLSEFLRHILELQATEG